MKLLKNMAVELKLTIIAALHQPSQEIWNLSDGLIVLTNKGGKTIVTAAKSSGVSELRR
jgi:ABC-type cobalamin/Fe3+-siderophores transport system ATPase subunit